MRWTGALHHCDWQRLFCSRRAYPNVAYQFSCFFSLYDRRFLVILLAYQTVAKNCCCCHRENMKGSSKQQEIKHAHIWTEIFNWCGLLLSKMIRDLYLLVKRHTCSPFSCRRGFAPNWPPWHRLPSRSCPEFVSTTRFELLQRPNTHRAEVYITSTSTHE